MAKIIKTNDTPRMLHIGAVTIPPYESREVDARDLPGYRAAAPKGQAEDPLAEAVNQILAHAAGQIGEMLPACSDTELAALIEAENAKDRPRKTVLQALEAERLRRAAEANDIEAEA